MSVNQNRWLKTHTWMAQLGIHEDDLEEQFIQGSGPGGQKINKTASCVFLKHKISGIVIKCQRARSRELNRLYAREELCAKISEIARNKHLEKKAEQSRERQRNRKPSKAEKERLKESKRRVSQKKSQRKPPKNNDY